jgi:hypothetical protein
MDAARSKDTKASESSPAGSAGLSGEAIASPREVLDDQAWYAKLVADGVAPLIAEAHVTHRRDLPTLLQRHSGKCAAYRGSERLAIGRSDLALYQKYGYQGSGLGEFVVFEIAPDVFQEEFEFPLPG